MTTNDKTRTGARRARLGTVGHCFRISRIAGLLGFRGSERGAFRSRCLSRESSILGSPLRFERPGRFFAAARRPSIFAFLSQNTPKSAKNYSTHSAGRDASQSIENNQSRYALLDTLRGSRGARHCERKISEDPPLHKPQGWGTRPPGDCVRDDNVKARVGGNGKAKSRRDAGATNAPLRKTGLRKETN